MAKKKGNEETENVLLKKDRNIFNLLFKITFFFCAFVLVIITVLSNMGGSYDALRESAEDLAGSLFGRRTAKIEKLVNMSFFPSVGLDIQGLRVFPYPDSRDVLVNVDKFKMYMSFWDVAVQSAKFKVLYLENMQAKAGAIGSRSFSAEKVFISHDQEMGAAQLIGKGKLGVHDWSLAIDMDIYGGERNYTYGLGKDFPLKLNVADVQIKAVVHKGGEFMRFEDLEITALGQKMKGSLSISGLGERLLKMRGELLAGSGEGKIVPDLIFDFSGEKTKISQTIELQSFPYEDFAGENSIFRFLGRVVDVVSYNEKGTKIDGVLSFFDMYDFDLDVAVNGIKVSGQEDNSVSFKIEKDGERAKISSLGGMYNKLAFKIPPFVRAKDAQGKLYMVLHDGAAALQVFDIFGADVAKKIFGGAENVPVTCGIAEVTGDDQGYKFDGGMIEAGGKRIDFAGEYALQDNLFKADSVFASEGVQLAYDGKNFASSGAESVDRAEYAAKPVVFDKGTYDYIADAFKSNRTDHPCLKYIVAKPEPVKKEEKEASASQNAVNEKKSDGALKSDGQKN